MTTEIWQTSKIHYTLWRKSWMRQLMITFINIHLDLFKFLNYRQWWLPQWTDIQRYLYFSTKKMIKQFKIVPPSSNKHLSYHISYTFTIINRNANKTWGWFSHEPILLHYREEHYWISANFHTKYLRWRALFRQACPKRKATGIWPSVKSSFSEIESLARCHVDLASGMQKLLPKRICSEQFLCLR